MSPLLITCGWGQRASGVLSGWWGRGPGGGSSLWGVRGAPQAFPRGPGLSGTGGGLLGCRGFSRGWKRCPAGLERTVQAGACFSWGFLCPSIKQGRRNPWAPEPFQGLLQLPHRQVQMACGSGRTAASQGGRTKLRQDPNPELGPLELLGISVGHLPACRGASVWGHVLSPPPAPAWTAESPVFPSPQDPPRGSSAVPSQSGRQPRLHLWSVGVPLEFLLLRSASASAPLRGDSYGEWGDYHRGRPGAGHRTLAPWGPHVQHLSGVHPSGASEGWSCSGEPPVPGTHPEGSRCCPQWWGLHPPSLGLCSSVLVGAAPGPLTSSSQPAGGQAPSGGTAAASGSWRDSSAQWWWWVNYRAGSRLWRVHCPRGWQGFSPLLAGYFLRLPGWSGHPALWAPSWLSNPPTPWGFLTTSKFGKVPCGCLSCVWVGLGLVGP